MADDQRDLAAHWGPCRRDAHIARLPGLDRHPGVQLAVVELDLALVINDEAGVVGVAAGLASMMEKQPQMWCSMHAALKDATSGPSRLTISSGAVLMERPCSVLGEDDESMVPRLRRALPTIQQMRSAWALSWAGVSTTGSCSCATR